MTKQQNQKLRNIAIIAHVDHGKTTLVDAMFRQSGLFREGKEMDDRIMDSMDLERERGITIAAKNCSVVWKDTKINILDTPGHADFGGEVERAMAMVNGAILLVDASEGPLPQTRFVLKKALEAGLVMLVVINKIDRKDARADEVLDEIYDLFIDLDASEDQLNFQVLYAIGRQGIVQPALDEPRENLHLLFDTILSEIPGPVYDSEEPFQMLVADLAYSDYMGRLAVGKIMNGSISSDDSLVCITEDNSRLPIKLTKLQVYQGMALKTVDRVDVGDIIVISGADNVKIGDTICSRTEPKALKRIRVDEPTVSMAFAINNGPMAGKEGKIVQSRKIQERLMKETLRNVAIRVEDTGSQECFIVKGRGEFQMAILIETMRREGFELCVGRPEVIYKEKNGKRQEPMEHVFVDCDEPFVGVVTEKLTHRKARMSNMVNKGTGRVRIEFIMPSRGLIGYREEFLTDTKGTGILNSYFSGYDDYMGDFPSRYTGSLVSDRQGKAVAYALFKLEPRGQLFVVPNNPVYEGMIVGEYNREVDLNVNPCKEKKLTNMRASGKDDAVVLTTVMPMTLERAIHFIKADEMVEATPLSIRLRKTILTAHNRPVGKGPIH
ncbi:MAG: translational GTPase TypA [Desulfobacteraceae bacterium]|nr:translational GTPase TypA [Pseudomonadota bacterium]MCG2754340.1 translational GTPase TypA [Desulfobacteraceae bacterium]